ncbi:A/G-specific adenine glycosylase [Tautonia plasticadhaerens]|uniref:Adenine DNA glycosylase n=1 Tax=Tautonia plasticadhaerens TaxID=2527974 RepID=A0A518HBY6_9BACT|nr:A/G-specific adenine glycosylase [Tautonia plasticadhaerens]QDV38347.1 putative A/G-specific adenine glycosylase YfhQ [Tautonia plasticadhaerens]
MGRRSGAGGPGSRPGGPGPSGPDLDPGWVDRARRAMLLWFDREGRAGLPWRLDRDPYKVLVAEVMLVQTTVTAVGPFFSRFVARFPTAEALASADEADVLKAWEGLGYYRRARLLQAAARALVERHGGRVPEDPGAIRALPGVGRYIAGAVSSIAFDLPEPILEANTQRVLARWLSWPEDVRSTRSQARLWEAAARLVPPEGAGRFNQAMMDLGATICTPRAPRCLACPAADLCLARREGLQDDLPRRSTPTPPLEVSEDCVLALDGLGRLLVVRRSPGRLWEHFYEFPTVHLSGADPAGRGPGGGDPEDLGPRLRELTGVSLRIGPVVRAIRYGVTKHRVTLGARVASPVGGEPRPGPGLSAVEWLSPEALDGLPRTGATRRLSAWAAANPEALQLPTP